MTTKETLPNSTAVFVLGICSIVLGYFAALIGLALGIIGVYMAKKGRQMYIEKPELYEGYGLLNAGWIMSIIGIVIGGLITIYSIFVLVALKSLLFK